MRVLLQGRIDLLDRVGGDTTVITDTKDAISRQGVEADINTDRIINLGRYDLIHFFGIMRIHDLYPFFLQGKKQYKKIVVTPIYEDLSYLDKYGRVGLERFVANILPNDLKELAKGLIRSIKDFSQLKLALLQLMIPYSKQQKDLLKYSNRIISTSYGESILLQKKFSLPKSKFDVIPIGIDKDTTKGDKNDFINKYNLKNFILSVGRIEPKKNQLAILKALGNAQIPIVFVGSLSDYHPEYTKKFIKLLRKYPNACYLGVLNKKMLISGYAAAKVHVLASWFETLGIVSMEAAINKCNIVTTSMGYAREYFGDLAWYCDSRDIDSIKKTVIKAYNAPIRTKLSQLILEKYTVQKTVPKIIKIYRKSLIDQQTKNSHENSFCHPSSISAQRATKE